MREGRPIRRDLKAFSSYSHWFWYDDILALEWARHDENLRAHKFDGCIQPVLDGLASGWHTAHERSAIVVT
jgi:hypothetical protein